MFKFSVMPCCPLPLQLHLQYLEASQFFVWCCAPFLVALASFATFVLVDPVNNILTSQVRK